VSVEAAVGRELRRIGAPWRDSVLAATALALAVELDADNSATSKSMVAKALNETMAELRALAPQKKGADPVDDLRDRRNARRSRASAS
jgi:histidinol-phosphate/aromatic aminotransferase/cobyric acid decarboxylase-like protein